MASTKLLMVKQTKFNIKEVKNKKNDPDAIDEYAKEHSDF